MSGYLVVPRERDKREVMELCRVGRDRNLGVRGTLGVFASQPPIGAQRSRALSTLTRMETVCSLIYMRLFYHQEMRTLKEEHSRKFESSHQHEYAPCGKA